LPPIVEIENPDDLDPKALPKGLYKAIIQDIELRQIPDDANFNAGDREVNWTFRIDDLDAPQEVQGRLVWQSTNIETGKGMLYKRFMTALDQDLHHIELDDIKEMEVQISLDEYMGKKDKVTGEKKIKNKVVEVLLP